jgi:hypothetical protein
MILLKTPMRQEHYLLKHHTVANDLHLQKIINKKYTRCKCECPMVKGLKQGLEQGAKQGLQQGVQALRTTLIRFVETHFPDQVSLAKQQAGLLTTQAQLQEMLDKLFVARTSDEARKMLLDLPQ